MKGGKMTDKRGISDIIVTVIIVGLALAAVAAVWAVVSGLIGQGTKSIDIGGKCLGVTVQAVAANCTGVPTTCTLTLQRTGTGSDPLGGVKVVFHNDTTNSGVLDVLGDVALLIGSQPVLTNVSLPGASIHTVDVTVYFKDTAGKTQLCSQTNSFTF
jgi:hypothetical protein